MPSFAGLIIGQTVKDLDLDSREKIWNPVARGKYRRWLIFQNVRQRLQMEFICSQLVRVHSLHKPGDLIPPCPDHLLQRS